MKKTKTPFYIGLLSFFGGISQDIFVPVLPLYLANVLHLDKSFIGLTEGIVTASSSFFKIIAGYLTDKFKSRKSVIFAGYFLSMISRPLLALVTGGTGILFLRFLDGAGKGIKDPPKDVLIAASDEENTRGRDFGVVRALDTLGSVAGPILLFVFLYLLRNNELKYHYIFFITAIPLVITLSIIIFFVKEAGKKHEEKKSEKNISKGFYVFLVITLIFALGDSGSAFLFLRAQNAGVAILAIPLIWALFNFFYASLSIPLGSLSDKIGREKVILIGWILFAFAYLGFGFANAAWQIWVLFAIYGVYFATNQGVAKAWIADLTASNKRGFAYGFYNTAIGIVALPASFIAGFLWDKINPQAPFLFGAALAGVASILLLIASSNII